MPSIYTASPSVSDLVPVATLVSFKSDHYVAVAWLATHELLCELVEAPSCTLAVIVSRLADKAARVRTLDAESATLQVLITQVEYDAREWWNDYRDRASLKRPRQPESDDE